MPEQLQRASLQILIQHFHQFKSKRIQTTNSAGTAPHAITADVLPISVIIATLAWSALLLLLLYYESY